MTDEKFEQLCFEVAGEYHSMTEAFNKNGMLEIFSPMTPRERMKTLSDALRIVYMKALLDKTVNPMDYL